MATHSSILAWKNPMDRGAWQAIVHDITKVGHNLATEQQLHLPVVLSVSQVTLQILSQA